MEECRNRGFKTEIGEEKLRFLSSSVPNGGSPKWLGDPKFHSSHRSRLLCKGEGDSVCEGLKSILKIKRIDDWLKTCIGKTKNQLKYLDIISLKNYYYSVTKTPLKTNFYAKYGWLDDPSCEYVWPSKIA